MLVMHSDEINALKQALPTQIDKGTSSALHIASPILLSVLEERILSRLEEMLKRLQEGEIYNPPPGPGDNTGYG
jgi:hypothetical protein